MFAKNDQAPDLEVFTIFDTKVGNYRDPVFAINRHDMIRGAEGFLRNQQNANDPLFVNAEDFQIFKIGTYTRRTGNLVGQKPEHIANMHEIKAMVERSKNPVGMNPT